MSFSFVIIHIPNIIFSTRTYFKNPCILNSQQYSFGSTIPFVASSMVLSLFVISHVALRAEQIFGLREMSQYAASR